MPNLKKNYLFFISYQMVKYFSPLVTMPYLSRVLDADGIGLYSFSFSIVTYFVIAIGLGTGGYGVKEISQQRENKTAYSESFWGIQMITFCSGAICLAGWLTFCLTRVEQKNLFLAFTPFIISAVADISWLFIGLERIVTLTTVNTLVKVLETLAIFLLVKTEEDLIWYTSILSLSTLISACTMWCFLPRLLVRISLQNLPYCRHLKETLIYFIPSVAVSLYKVLDKTLIGVFAPGGEESGFYEQATKIISFAETVSFSCFHTVVAPRMAFLFTHNEDSSYERVFNKSINFVLTITIGVTFGVISVAKNFIPLFLGDRYLPVIGLLYLLAPVIPIICVSNCLGSLYYTPCGKRTQSARYIVIGACMNLLLDMLIIPRWGGRGAAVATVAAEIVITVLYISHSAGLVTGYKLLHWTGKRIVAGVGMLLSEIAFARNISIPEIPALTIQVLGGAAIYFLILLLLKDEIFLYIKSTLMELRRRE